MPFSLAIAVAIAMAGATGYLGRRLEVVLPARGHEAAKIRAS